MSDRLTLEAFRKLFPLFEQKRIYLNTAGTAPGASPVVSRLRQAMTEWEEGTFSSRHWDEEGQQTRALFARLIGAAPEAARNIAMLSTTAEGATTIARSLPLGKIVVGECEFRSNFFPWLAMEQEGYTITVVPARDDIVSTEALMQAIDEQTVLVAVSTVQFLHGYRVNLPALAQRAREVGARLFIDATQSLGVLPLDITTLQPDYVIAHGYKWLLCPRGTTWLYVSPQRLAEVKPLVNSWKSVEDPFTKMDGGPFQLAGDARKLDISMAWFSWLGARSALELLLSLEATEIEQHCLALANHFRQQAESEQIAVMPTELPSHILSMRVKQPAAVMAQLAKNALYVGARGPYLRLGFHAFNNESDVTNTLRLLHTIPDLQ